LEILYVGSDAAEHCFNELLAVFHSLEPASFIVPSVMRWRLRLTQHVVDIGSSHEGAGELGRAGVPCAMVRDHHERAAD
jgi:hypothetical protein